MSKRLVQGFEQLKYLFVCFYLMGSLCSLSALSVEDWWARIQPSLDQRDFNQIALQLDQALKEHPNQENFYTTRLWTARELKDWNMAESLLTSAKSRFGSAAGVVKEEAWLRYSLAWVQWNAGQLEKGTASMEEAWKLLPKEFWIILGQAQSRIRNALPELAVQMLESPEFPAPSEDLQKENLNTTLGWAYAEWANVAQKAGNLEAYLERSTQVYRLAGHTDWGLNHWAYSRIAAKDWVNGEKLFLQGLRDFPAYPHFRENLQALYNSWADAAPPRAGELREKMYELGPEIRPDWVTQAWTRQMVLDKRASEAVDILRMASARKPHEPYLDETLAWALGEAASAQAAAGKHFSALDLWEEARTRSPQIWWTWIGEAWGAYSLARNQEKNILFNRIQNLLPGLWARMKAEPPGVTRDQLARPVWELIQVTKDRRFLDKIAPEVENTRPLEDRLLQGLGATLSFLNNLQKPPDPATFQRALNLVRQARTLWDARNPVPNMLKLSLPLSGRFQVFTAWNDPLAVTHNGNLTHSYDFVYVDDLGNPLHPGTLGRVNHEWLTFGQPVISAAAGEVVNAEDGMEDRPVGLPDYYGNGVTVRTPEGYDVIYGHLKNGSVRVKKGQVVKIGDVLGAVGSSGYSFSPHLHFMVLNQEGVSVPYIFTDVKGDPDGILESLQILNQE